MTPDLSPSGLKWIEDRANEATPGHWYYNSYRTLVSGDRTEAFNAAVDGMPEDATDEQWEELEKTAPKPAIATFYGGHEGLPDARYVEAVQPIVVKAMIARIRDLEEEVDQMHRDAAGECI